MSKLSTPPYKPPQELQDILDKQAGQRNRTIKLPKRSWVYRNPRLFQISCITISMLVFFSKPLYDAFFQPSFPEIEESIRSRKRQ